MIAVTPTPTTSAETYPAICWSCLKDFDAMGAAWCSHDPKLPSKMCPSCQRCFCQASDKYKQEFWRRAPASLLEELEILSRNKDRLGEILIQMGKLTTSQLLTALILQTNRTGEPSLAQTLREEGMVADEDIETAIKTRGGTPLTDTRGAKYSAQVVCDGNDPQAIIQYLLSLAVRRGASEVHIEPKSDGLAVKYRIDGVSFRLDPIPLKFEAELVRKAFEIFRLDPTRPHRPQRGRTTERLADGDFDLVAQTLPTAHGTSISMKLVDRTSFIKDFTTLGLTLDDRLRLVGALRQSFGLILVTGPMFEGGNSTAFSIMDFMVRAQREVVSLESPVLWLVEGARQVEVNEADTPMHDALRAAIAVHPDVVVLFKVPDAQTALLATQLASSLVVVCVVPAQSTTQAISTFLDLGVPRHLLAGALSAVTCQRLVRKICAICRESVRGPSAQTLAWVGIAPEDVARLGFYRGKGCPSCNRVGYRGRQAIFEVLTGAPEVVSGIMNGLPAIDIEILAKGSGMRLLRERAIELVAQGVTTFDEFQSLRL
jgi:type II secretory ATPase GspE/PulE/Tfp pilus assembly ATPase PilB-like protein